MYRAGLNGPNPRMPRLRRELVAARYLAAGRSHSLKWIGPWVKPLLVLIVTSIYAFTEDALAEDVKSSETGADAVKAAKPEALEVRAGAYYKALIRKDYAGAYDFFTPGYREARNLSEHYQISRPNGIYLDAAVESIKCASESACDVVVDAIFEFGPDLGPVAGTKTALDVKNRWVLVDDQWYLLPDN